VTQGYPGSDAHPEFFIWGGGGGWWADPEAIYNFFDFKNNVIKSCCKYNVTAFIYIRI
jgi:hypothetical protein